MKTFLPLSLVFLLAACRTPPATPLLPLPTKSAPEPRAIALASPAPTSTPEPKAQEEARLIDALLSQNDALKAQLAASVSGMPTPPTMANPVTPTAPATSAPMPATESRSAPIPAVVPPPAAPPDPSLLVPNADGVIDVAAVALAQTSGETANPFAVRSIPADRVRDVTLRIAGLVGGDRPCAVVNDRRVQAGDHIESLTVQRIEPDAVVFAYGEHRLRLPVADTPAHVRLPL